MTPPRQVHVQQTVFITWRAVNRSFRFVPTEKVTQILWFTLAYACERCGVLLHEAVVLSNHGHILVTFERKNMPEFMGLMNSLASRALNALRGTNGCNIEKHYNVVTPQDDGKLLDHAVYTLVNPCAAALVGRARAWKGVTTARMRYDGSMVVSKPAFALWSGKNDSAPSKNKKRRRLRRGARPASAVGRSVIPDEVTLVLTRPPTVGGEDCLAELDDQQLRDEVMKLLFRQT